VLFSKAVKLHSALKTTEYTGWSNRLCAPDDYNTESYKYCSKCPPPISKHLLKGRTVFSKTVLSIARSTFRMYSVLAIFNSSVVWGIFVRCTETFWSPCTKQFKKKYVFSCSVCRIFRYEMKSHNGEKNWKLSRSYLHVLYKIVWCSSHNIRNLPKATKWITLRNWI
jgi:hypothetical protein